MIEFQKIFNLKIIKYLTIAMGLFSLFLVLFFDITRLSELGDWNDVTFITLRDMYLPPYDLNSYLTIFCQVLCVASGVVFYIVSLNLIKIQKARNNENQLRQMLIATSLYLAISRTIEIFYITFYTDFDAFREVFGQFYITLDVLAIIISISMTFIIFIKEELTNKPALSVGIFIFLMFSYLFGYLMMIFYGLNSEAFSNGVVIAFGLFLLISLLSVIVVVDILRLRNRITKNKNALMFIALQLVLMVASLIFMILSGLTAEMAHTGNYVPNRLFRIARLTCLLISAITFLPAYIIPAKKSLKVKN